MTIGLLEDMKVIRPDFKYYSITLTASEDGKSIFHDCQGHWVGRSKASSDEPEYELRAASIVMPDRMAALWTKLKQPYVCVNDQDALAIWFGGIGGNALVEKGLADRFLDFIVKARPVAQGGPDGGFVDVETASPKSLQHRPTPTLRMEVIKRDGYVCRVCGENPRRNEHIVLHVHHIRLHSKGGLTEKWNLITLCHTCHDGLKPHDEPELFSLIDTPRVPGAEASRYELHQGTLAFQRIVERLRKRRSSKPRARADASKTGNGRVKTSRRKKPRKRAK